jgi:malonyl-CoA decarboxylase
VIQETELTAPVRRLVHLARDAVLAQGSDTSRFARFCAGYRRLPAPARAALLGALDGELEVGREEVAKPLWALAIVDGHDPAAWSGALAALRHSLVSTRKKFLSSLMNLRHGMRFALSMRADIIELSRSHGVRVDGLEADLTELFEDWFRQSFLILQEVDRRSPLQMVHFLKEHDLVQPVVGLDAMDRRLGRGRRCFALCHCVMPDEPVLFVEVALSRGLIRSIHQIIDEGLSLQGASRPDTAIFYSINNTQNGLAGLGLGAQLIYRVTEVLRRTVATLDTFATLSPLPGFWTRFLRPLLAGEGAGLATTRESIACLFSRDEARKLGALAGATAGSPGGDVPECLLELLSSPRWSEDREVVQLLGRPLCELAFEYIKREKDSRGRPLDPVANFHLGNGATVQRSDINFFANRSQRGISESCTIMVNYVYSTAWFRQIGRTLRSLASPVRGRVMREADTHE